MKTTRKPQDAAATANAKLRDAGESGVEST